MSTQPLVGYGGYTPEEYQRIVRRAHAERAEALRQFLQSLLAWRGKVARPRASAPQHAAVGCR